MNFVTVPQKIALSRGLIGRDGHRPQIDWSASVFDVDSRRWLRVICRKGAKALDEPDSFEEPFEETYPLCAAIRAEIDAGPPDLTALVFNVDYHVLCRSTDPYDDVTPGTHYAALSEYQIPAHTKVLGRDELLELERLIAFVDIVAPVSSPSPDQERLIFKYYSYVYGIPGNWNSIHIQAKLSDHPHIAPLRHVVVDETDRSRVVGFTMPYYPGGDLLTRSKTPGRPFHLKLKWIQQLIRTLDDLHLKYGVIHGDANSHNMVIDPATDNLVLIDFGGAQKIGLPHNHRHLRAAITHEPRRNPLWDIAGEIRQAIFAVYGLVTNNYRPHTNENGVSDDYVRAGGWVKAPNVTLDGRAEDYYRTCMDWLRARNAAPKIIKHCQASDPLNYPDYMTPPEIDIKAFEKELANNPHLRPKSPSPKLTEEPGLLEDMRAPYDLFMAFDCGEWAVQVAGDRHKTSGRNFRRLNATEAGLAVLNWERPLTVHLDRDRPLLANGRYQDEYVRATSAATTTQRKRKHGAGKEEVVDQEPRQHEDNHGGRAPDGEGVAPTRRITRSATKKQTGIAGPTPCKPQRKGAALKKQKRKVAPAKAQE